MSTCVKCSVIISNNKEVLVCSDCKGAFHPTCTRVESLKNFQKFSSQRKAAWKCDVCKCETTSSANRGDGDMSSILESIQNMGKDLSNQIGIVNTNIEDVKGQLEGVQNTIVDIQATLTTLISDTEDLKTKYSQVTEEQQKTKAEVLELQRQV
ncbi:hypothetical protein J6590_047820 [Homalodisca vitripennis]|nr:hypothetical protein J6590_047820 [Homalodisca vitripennis]